MRLETSVSLIHDDLPPLEHNTAPEVETGSNKSDWTATMSQTNSSSYHLPHFLLLIFCPNIKLSFLLRAEVPTLDIKAYVKWENTGFTK